MPAAAAAPPGAVTVTITVTHSHTHALENLYTYAQQVSSCTHTHHYCTVQHTFHTQHTATQTHLTSQRTYSHTLSTSVARSCSSACDSGACLALFYIVIIRKRTAGGDPQGSGVCDAIGGAEVYRGCQDQYITQYVFCSVVCVLGYCCLCACLSRVYV